MHPYIKTRLRFIEFLILNFGEATIEHVLTYFNDIPYASAKKDFKTYREMAPNNITHIPSEKLFVKTDEFEPIFIKPKE